MAASHTPSPWHMELYINEKDDTFPPNVIGIHDNYPVAVCWGLDEETDQANGRLIAAAPELLEACEAAVVALLEEHPGQALSEANLRAVNLCRAACNKALDELIGN